ncbi:MAG: AAA family ATPase [Actinomycetia bacterium]|nr:AAA family ATPase [Actinomycetes bacterium]
MSGSETGIELEAAVAESHISTVFFTPDRAYKILKPLKTSFLDHSTSGQRLRSIDDELALNRRMAPDVYLGTADVVERGAVVDRMLVMRRMPADRRLSELVASGADVASCLRAIARQVAVFHQAQEPADDGHELGGRDAVRANWAGNFGDLQSVRGTLISDEAYDRVAYLSDRYLEYRGPLFEARLAIGAVRDGHGDLTAQDIFCLDDGPRILDCLAFDRRLRVADVLADIAFLAMDLERLSPDELESSSALAGSSLTSDFLHWYQEFSNEHHPPSLADHYVAYRAHVRAKVGTIRHRQGDPTAGPKVRTYHDLCLRHLERGRVRMFIIGGGPGTGKTTMARTMADSYQAMNLSTDEVRKDLTGRSHLDREFTPVGEGIYSADMTDRTYDHLLERASKVLDGGRSVVLDGSWSLARQRADALTLARVKGADAIEIECVLDAETAEARIVERLAEGQDPSDARPELLDELRRRREPWPSAVNIDSSGSFGDAHSRALAIVADLDGAAQGSEVQI